MNKNILIVVITLLVGLGGGYWFALYSDKGQGQSNEQMSEEKPQSEVLFWRNPMNPAITSPVFTKDEMGMDYIPVYAEEKKPKGERKVLFWRNPMNPAITSPVFAKDEMGMDYIPVYADEDKNAQEPSGTVRIDATTIQNIGVRTAKVKRQTMSRIIRSVGRITYDEQRLTKLHPKIEGWVEALNVEKTGEKVKRDTVLLSIYSPQLVATQQEFLLALKNSEALKNSPYPDISKGAQDLLKSTEQRLIMLDVPEHQINELKRTREIKKTLHIHSPFDGIVVNLGVRQGQYITPMDELYMLADLSNVWVYVDVYEDELPWVRVKDKADMSVAAVPGKIFRGKVTYIYPYLESKTRTVKVRLEFSNKDGALKPDMFAEVNLHADRQFDAIIIPTEAIVRSGSREQVFVVRDKGKFEPREVKLGINADGVTQVLEGLKEGEIIVTSSQFLIDSESKLREATAKLMDSTPSEDAAQKVEPQQHSDMDMADMNMENEPMNDLDMSDMSMDNIKSEQSNAGQGAAHKHSGH